MIIDVLIEKLTKSGLVVPGESLFREMMPAEVSVGVMIRSPLTGIKIDPYIADWYKAKMQVITRHTDPLKGQALANDICAALTVQQPELYEATEGRNAVKVIRFYPETLPIQFPRLKGNGIEFSQQFQTVFAVI